MTRLNTWQDGNGFDQYGLSFLFFSLNGREVNYRKVQAVRYSPHQQTCNFDGLSSGDAGRRLQDGRAPFCFVVNQT